MNSDTLTTNKNAHISLVTKELTTREFTDIADIAYSQVWALESGQGDPSLTTLLAIAKTLGVTLDGLVPQEK